MDAATGSTYIAAMGRFVRTRRWIALFAAYTVAAQIFLLPLTVAAFALPALTLCSATELPPNADHRGTVCPCAAGCGSHCSTQGTAPSAAVVDVAVPQVHAVRLAAAYDGAPARLLGRYAPHIPRAPPAA